MGFQATALQYAAQAGSDIGVRMLLEHKANISTKTAVFFRLTSFYPVAFVTVFVLS